MADSGLILAWFFNNGSGDTRMVADDRGSLTKEVPLSTIDQTLIAITPGMPFDDLRAYARKNTHADAPGLVRKRFILVDETERITHDEFLSLIQRVGIISPIIRKTMLFVWAYRDERIRRFIIERIASTAGKWSTANLRKKANAVFFESWFKPGPSTKARSNFDPSSTVPILK
jgi:hypothetical protein